MKNEFNEKDKVFEGGVNKFLDVSTAHFTNDDDLLLTAIAKGSRGTEEISLTVYGHAYGYWVHVHSDMTDNYHGYVEHLINAGLSAECVDILRVANELDCSYVNFDCDGLKYEGIPTFDW